MSRMQKCSRNLNSYNTILSPVVCRHGDDVCRHGVSGRDQFDQINVNPWTRFSATNSNGIIQVQCLQQTIGIFLMNIVSSSSSCCTSRAQFNMPSWGLLQNAHVQFELYKSWQILLLWASKRFCSSISEHSSLLCGAWYWKKRLTWSTRERMVKRIFFSKKNTRISHNLLHGMFTVRLRVLEKLRVLCQGVKAMGCFKSAVDVMLICINDEL